jgi:plasmid rolling circle replication initiator protein Rep
MKDISVAPKFLHRQTDRQTDRNDKFNGRIFCKFHQQRSKEVILVFQDVAGEDMLFHALFCSQSGEQKRTSD